MLLLAGGPELPQTLWPLAGHWPFHPGESGNTLGPFGVRV